MLKTGPVVGQHFRIRWEETSQTSEIGNHMQAFLLGCEIPSQPPEVLVLMRPKVTSMLADWKHAQPELSPSGKTCVQPRPPSMTRVAGGRCAPIPGRDEDDTGTHGGVPLVSCPGYHCFFTWAPCG